MYRLNYLKSGKSKTVVYSLLCALLLFIQLVALRYVIFGSIYVSALWRNPMVFLDFYAPRIAFCIGCSLFLFVVKNKWWCIICSIVISAIYFIIPMDGNVVLNVCLILIPILIGILWIFLKSDYCFEVQWKDVLIKDNLVFLGLLLLLLLIFHWITFGALTEFWLSICYKLSATFFLAGCICLFHKKHLLSFIVLLLSTIWLSAEIIYFRANGFFLDSCSITMVDNMDGFWSCLPMYMHLSDLMIFIPLVCQMVYWGINSKRQNCNIPQSWTIVLFAASMILNLVAGVWLQKDLYKATIRHRNIAVKNPTELNPFTSQAVYWMNLEMEDYVEKVSPLHAFVYNIRDLIEVQMNVANADLSEEEQELMTRFISPSYNLIKPNTRLVICLIESLENWVITPDYMPNLYRYAHTHNNLLYAKYVKSQVGAGVSSDGQLIVNTGLVPIKTGAVCFRNYKNLFPSLTSIYSSSCGVFPHDLTVWNQSQMSQAYGIDTNYVFSNSDRLLFKGMLGVQKRYDCVLMITCSTHTPFEVYCDSSKLELDAKMPQYMSNYIRSMNYMDGGLKYLLEAIDTDSMLSHSTVLITGDHTIFHADMRDRFEDYVNKTGAELRVCEDYSPCLIYSPNIDGRVELNEKFYQMDIYPTILKIIGADNYYWKGFGNNMLDDAPRKISVDSVRNLSEKVILSNYFNQIELTK